MALNESSFSINVTAESGENYAGMFKCRRRLSHMQSLRRDELRRELLGKNPESAPPAMMQNAFILSTVAAYITDGPGWFMNSAGGTELLDEEPLAKLFEEISTVIKTVNDELEAKALKAKEALKVA